MVTCGPAGAWLDPLTSEDDSTLRVHVTLGPGCGLATILGSKLESRSRGTLISCAPARRRGVNVAAETVRILAR